MNKIQQEKYFKETKKLRPKPQAVNFKDMHLFECQKCFLRINIPGNDIWHARKRNMLSYNVQVLAHEPCNASKTASEPVDQHCRHHSYK